MNVTRYFLTDQEKIYADNNQLHLIPAADQRNPDELTVYTPEKQPARVYTGKYARLTKKYLVEQLATGIKVKVKDLAKQLGMPYGTLKRTIFEYGISRRLSRDERTSRNS